jgi:hypothetical protein
MGEVACGQLVIICHGGSKLFWWGAKFPADEAPRNRLKRSQNFFHQAHHNTHIVPPNITKYKRGIAPISTTETRRSDFYVEFRAELKAMAKDLAQRSYVSHDILPP